MHSQPTIAVMIVTNQPIMRDGLRLRVQQESDMRVACETSDLPQTVRDFHLCRPDVVVIDLQLPRGADLRIMTAIRKVSPGAPLVVLANYPDEIDTSPHAGEGATVMVSKTLVSEQLILAIRQAITATQGSGGAGSM
jgi:DNA-binding NarL/FixJ family response regulator